MMKKLYLLFLFLALFYQVCAQGNDIDTVYQKVKTLKDDTAKVDYLNFTAFSLRRVNILAAKELLAKSKEILDNSHDQKGLASYYSVSGLVAKSENNINKAIEDLNKAAIILKKLNKAQQVSDVYNNLGNVYLENNRLKEALQYFQLSLNYLTEKLKEERSIRYTNIGDLYVKLNQLDSAEFYYKKSEVIEREINSAEGLYYDMLGLANVEKKKKNYTKAIEYFNFALSYASKINDEIGQAQCILELGGIHQLKGDYKKARSEFNSARIMVEKIGNTQLLIAIYQLLSENASKLNASIEAVEYYKKHLALKDVLSKQDVQNLLAEASAKQLDIEKKQQLELLKTNSEIDNIKRIALISVLFIFLTVIVLVIFIYRKHRSHHLLEIEKNNRVIQQKELIENKNRQIMRGLSYAKRIQTALLPSRKKIEEQFPGIFIFFKPKETVSGDFYWYKNTSDGALLASIDCTGHGVPGALMSILAYSVLNTSVSATNQPDLFLARVSKIFKENFKDANAKGIRDGMEVTVLFKEHSTNLLKVASAFQPWIQISDGKLNDIKGDPLPIGSGNVEYTSYTLPDKFENLFLFSDGYFDQKGGPDNKKFFYSRFKTLLESIKNMAPQEQQNALTETMNEWMNAREQMDDMLIIGIKKENV